MKKKNENNFCVMICKGDKMSMCPNGHFPQYKYT